MSFHVTNLATAGETAMVQYVDEDGSDNNMKGKEVFGNN